jgi:hypothetical protein
LSGKIFSNTLIGQCPRPSPATGNWPRAVDIQLTPSFSVPILPIDDDDDDLTATNWGWKVMSSPVSGREASPSLEPPPHGLLLSMGFRAWYSRDSFSLSLPFWFLGLTTLALAIVFRHWSGRFNLRSLFVVTTFLAVVLGMSAWLDRAWIGK